MALALRPFIVASALTLSLAMAACDGPADKTSDTLKTAGTATEPAAGDVRRDREDILDEYDEALETARETHGAGAPALWTLSDEDTTVYLFGTVHLLRPDIEWRTPQFDEKFGSADKIVLELDMKSPEGQQAMARDFLLKGMYDDGRTLSAQLSEGDLKVLKSAIDPLGIPVTALDPMEPWMAAMNLSVASLQKDGFDPNSGIEQVLIAEAEADEKSFAFLETADIQAGIFDNLPEPVQKEFLYETALTLDDSTKMLDQVVEEWADGDVKGLGVLVANPDTSGGEGIYESMFLNRNESWVPKIEALLEEPGTVFVAVGAGHLAGPDSVITLLRNKGYEIEGP